MVEIGTTACKWDSIIPLNEMWERVNKLIKPNGAICLFGSQPFTSVLISSNIKKYKHSWVWHKKNAGNLLVAKYQPLKTTEDVMVFTHKGERVNYYPIMSSGHKDRSKDRPTKKERICITLLKADSLNTPIINEETKDTLSI